MEKWKDDIIKHTKKYKKTGAEKNHDIVTLVKSNSIVRENLFEHIFKRVTRGLTFQVKYTLQLMPGLCGVK